MTENAILQPNQYEFDRLAFSVFQETRFRIASHRRISMIAPTAAGSPLHPGDPTLRPALGTMPRQRLSNIVVPPVQRNLIRDFSHINLSVYVCPMFH